MKNGEIYKNIVINGEIFDCSTPKIMAILNITPDSFYASSRAQNEEQILCKMEQYLTQGADIVDLGACSTRPGAELISPQKECEQICFALEIIRKKYPTIPISVDTFRATVVRAAIPFNINIINDISAFELDNDMLSAIVEAQLPYVLMHSKGTPQTMQQLAQYDDITAEELQFFARKIDTLRSAGFNKEIIIDPGFGFAKTVEQNYKLLANLNAFECFNAPILVGLSRKTMIYRPLEITPDEALVGSSILNFAALNKGANIIRTHDVTETKQAITLYNLLNA